MVQGHNVKFRFFLIIDTIFNLYYLCTNLNRTIQYYVSILIFQIILKWSSILSQVFLVNFFSLHFLFFFFFFQILSRVSSRYAFLRRRIALGDDYQQWRQQYLAKHWRTSNCCCFIIFFFFILFHFVNTCSIPAVSLNLIDNVYTRKVFFVSSKTYCLRHPLYLLCIILRLFVF